MAVTYGFFDSINGDRTYNADDIGNYFLKLISNGVFATPSTSLQVQATTGMTVNVAAGWGFITHTDSLTVGDSHPIPFPPIIPCL